MSAGYAARAAEQPQRFARIDADRPRERVWQAVADVLLARGWIGADALARSASA